MAKHWTKGKAGQQRSKKRRPSRAVQNEDASTARGTFGGMRRRTQGFFHGKQGPKTSLGKVTDTLLWVAVAVAGYFLVSSQCAR